VRDPGPRRIPGDGRLPYESLSWPRYAGGERSKITGTTYAENHHLAKKPNYEFEKRKKELEKKAKKEEKRQRKLENSANNTDDASLEAPDEGSQAPSE
jgi:hypothetical protein